MSYTMSFDASCKVKRAEVRGYLNHAARDVDAKNGVEVRHSNQDIDATRTAQNITAVYDAKSGKLKRCTDSDDLVKALDARLSSVKGKLRKDAVVMRPIIMQLDPEWYKEHKDEDERYKSYEAMLQWAGKTFGKKNVIGFSVHHDETSPHMHIFVTPVTDDGRLSQKDWYSGPTALRKMHDDLRADMRDAGFDIEMGRKKPGKHAKRMSVDEYKDFAELQKQKENVEVREGSVAWREMMLQEQEEQVKARERAVEAKERAVKKKEAMMRRVCEDAQILHDKAVSDENAVMKWAEKKGYRTSVENIQKQTVKREALAQKVQRGLRDVSDLPLDDTPKTDHQPGCYL